MALKDVKKMCSKFCNGNSSNIVGYTPPTLHKGVRWFVDFTSLDPARGLMRRKRYYIKDSLSVSEKKRRASEIMDVLTKQLAQGWNPWVTDDESRGFVYFDNCLERYLDYVDRMDRKKTRQSYRSRVNILREFITSQVNPIKYAYQFDIGFCNDFIDWIYLDRESSPRTRNNYRGWLYGLAEFLIARKHINTNPVEHIKVMPEHEKYRKDLTPEMLNQMSNYLCRNDKSFFLACLMQYYTLIRPGELSHLKIGDISLEEKFPIGCVMDMLDDDMDLLLLYHGTSKTDSNIHHCCFFASPKLGQSMYKVNMVSQPNGFIDGISVTIYDSIDVWEDELESDLLSHEASFDFIEAMTAAKLLSVFCKMNYDG